MIHPEFKEKADEFDKKCEAGFPSKETAFQELHSICDAFAKADLDEDTKYRFFFCIRRFLYYTKRIGEGEADAQAQV